MKKIGLFYGSDTGKTETIAEKIQDIIGRDKVDLHNLAEIAVAEVLNYDYIILGAPTWYDGELQSDWEKKLPELKKLNFTEKKIAIFGLGDQYGYAEYFLDAVGTIAEAIVPQGATLVGLWENVGYAHTASKAEKNGYFLGLALDEDNQAELSDERIKQWLAILLNEFV